MCLTPGGPPRLMPASLRWTETRHLSALGLAERPWRPSVPAALQIHSRERLSPERGNQRPEPRSFSFLKAASLPTRQSPHPAGLSLELGHSSSHPLCAPLLPGQASKKHFRSNAGSFPCSIFRIPLLLLLPAEVKAGEGRGRLAPLLPQLLRPVPSPSLCFSPYFFCLMSRASPAPQRVAAAETSSSGFQISEEF